MPPQNHVTKVSRRIPTNSTHIEAIICNCTRTLTRKTNQTTEHTIFCLLAPLLPNVMWSCLTAYDKCVHQRPVSACVRVYLRYDNKSPDTHTIMPYATHAPIRFIATSSCAQQECINGFSIHNDDDDDDDDVIKRQCQQSESHAASKRYHGCLNGLFNA